MTKNICETQNTDEMKEEFDKAIDFLADRIYLSSRVFPPRVREGYINTNLDAFRGLMQLHIKARMAAEVEKNDG
jgi:hypothetical protein